MMVAVEKLDVGVNGVILPVSRDGVSGYVFEAPDKTVGPFRPAGRTQTGDMRAFARAQADWRAWLVAHPASTR